MTSKAWQVSVINPILCRRVQPLTGPYSESVRCALHVLWMPSQGEYVRMDNSECPVSNYKLRAQETTVSQRLRRASSVILSNRTRMEPPMNRDDCYSATHPSEHNSVHILKKSGRGRDFREADWRSRREKEGEKIGKGGRKSKNPELEERYLRGRSHEFPFLMPIPKVHGYGCPQVQPFHAGGCAAVRR